MSLARSLHDFLRSRTLTVWLVGLFILYYLTTAVWVGEAFGRYVMHLSSSTVFRAYYLLFLANVVLRSVDALVAVRTSRRTMLLRLPLSLGLVIDQSAKAKSTRVYAKKDGKWWLVHANFAPAN